MPIQNLCPMCFFFLSCLRVIVLFSTIKDTYGKLLLSFDIFLSQCKKTFSGNKNKIQSTFISEDSSYHFFFFFLRCHAWCMLGGSCLSTSDNCGHICMTWPRNRNYFSVMTDSSPLFTSALKNFLTLSTYDIRRILLKKHISVASYLHTP